MAAGSLGRLTLDLAVRLSEFTDGLSRAERETRERTENMGESVRTFRDQMMEDLGGTQLGSVIDGLNSRLASISGGGMMAGAAIAGMAVGGIAVATGALVTMALETAKADVQLQVMATTANVGLRSFQVLTHAAAGLGVEQDALAGILADVQEKLGEFSATGGGGAADFFEALQNNTKMTDEEIRNLGKTLQGKDGAEAIQLIKNEMDALGATSQEQRFVFESLAGDLGNLMPLFADGGDILNKYGKELDDAGVIKTKEAIDESRKLAAQTQAIQTKMEGLKTQLVTEMIPALGTLTTYFTEGTTKGKGFRNEVNNVGSAIRTTAALVVGLAGGISIIAEAFMQVGAQMRNIGETATAFFDAEGIVAKGKVLAVGFTKTALIGADGYMSVTQKYEKTIKTINQLMLGQQAALTGLAGANNELFEATGDTSKGLVLNTVEADANAKALEELSKKNSKAAKSVKELGSAYVSNTALSGLKLKSNEAIAGGKARGYTAEFAELTQALIGGNLKYFSAINDTYHKGTNSKHATGQAFDIVLKDAKKANQAVAQLKAAAKEYGYQIKVLNEYSHPSKNATGGHLHVSVYGQKDNGKGGADIAWIRQQNNALLSEQKEANKEALREREDILRRQGSIAAKYATDEEKIESDHLDNIKEIKALYAENSAKYIDYMAREELDYFEKKNAKVTAILVKYLDGEAKITYEHGLALKAIEMANVKDDKARQELITKQNKAYQEDLDNFRFAAGQKKREQDKLYKSIADSARANGINSISTGVDSMAQRTMSDDAYQAWRLAQDNYEAVGSVNSQYADRQSEINATDERGDFLLPELKRNELLEIARQEHLDAMWAMEQDFALKEQNLDKQQAAQRVAIYQGLFSGLTGLTQAFAGEQSTAYRVMFAIEKAFAVAQSVIAIQQSIAKAMAVGFPANIPLIAQSVTQGAQIMSAIKNVQAPTVSGIAHGGLDYVPKESTYLLDQGERVLSPRQNKDLANFMAKGQNSNMGNITINDYSTGTDVRASRQPNGEVTIEMVDKMIEKSFRRIGQANSIESKSIQRGTTARVNRR